MQHSLLLVAIITHCWFLTHVIWKQLPSWDEFSLGSETHKLQGFVLTLFGLCVVPHGKMTKCKDCTRFDIQEQYTDTWQVKLHQWQWLWFNMQQWNLLYGLVVDLHECSWLHVSVGGKWIRISLWLFFWYSRWPDSKQAGRSLLTFYTVVKAPTML